MHRITRRTFLRASAGTALAVYLGGCGSSSTQSGTVRLPGGTFGFQVEVNSHVRAKVEYNWNHELGVPSFPHDVITSSIVVATD